ncbi:ATP2A2 isoform 12 [Pongo abelii]|uniref:ATP2A2 isoform 12 n=1 Tax=Pongo abelii TaxID=9601 RepID=A0A2J8XL88_PONAB|nr:ATP2A2 isoform 12 [Pongo abelii]
MQLWVCGRKEMLKMPSKPLRNMSLKWAKCIDRTERVYSGLKLKT